MHPLQWLSARKRLASIVTIVALVAAPVTVAVLYKGFPVSDVELTARDVWVTNNQLGLAGRLNMQIRELNGAATVPANEFDVLQDGDDVFVLQSGGEELARVDASYTTLGEKIELSPGSTASFGGARLAILSPEGKLWILDSTQTLQFDPIATAPVLDDLGPGSVAVVAQTGTVFALSGSTGELYRIDLGGAPVAKLGLTPSEFLLSTVGDRAVLLDQTSRQLIFDDGSVATLEGTIFGLQQPGPDRPFVVVANDAGLLKVGFDKSVTALDAEIPSAGSKLAAPVIVGDCIHAAWNSGPTYLRVCGDEPPTVKHDFATTAADTTLRFRVNRNVVALNDLTTGDAWLYSDSPQLVSNWAEVQPPDEEQSGETDETTTVESFTDVLEKRTEENHAPEAQNDTYGARPGRTTILAVLDNDTDDDGDVLTISSVTDIPEAIGVIQIIDSGRALQFVPTETAAGTPSFRYSVSDGRGGVSEARVDVSIVPFSTNTAPLQLRTTSVGVESGGTVSYNVFGDWRDPEGDDLILLGASTSTDDIVRFNADGLVTFSSVATAIGNQVLTLTVSDGALPESGELVMTVTQSGVLAPVGTPDFVSTFVGQTAEVSPLDNDVSPSGETLTLGETTPLGVPIQYATDPENDRLSFFANAVGSFYVQYEVHAGSKTGLGVIRVDVLENSAAVDPVAVKDIVYLRGIEPALVSPLDNDVSPSGTVLGVQGVDIDPDDAVKISVEVLGGSRLRVTASQALTEPLEFRYTISDGVGLASSAGVMVIPVPDLTHHQAPIAADDIAKVRAGDIVSVPVLLNDSHPDGAPVTLDPELVDTNVGNGTAFVTGNKVRLQAPTEAGQYSVSYRIVDAFGESSTAKVIFKVADLDPENNQPPLPRPVIARVFQSSEIEVELPLDRIDPDGDSVVFVGATGANLGRVTSTTATSFTYKASSRSGTEVLTYEVRDAEGASATAQVRIGVIPRGGIQPPSALDDEAGIRPDRTATIGVLSNDSDPNGYAIRLSKLISVETGIEAEIVGNDMVVTAGAKPGTYAINYEILNAENGADDAFVIVTVAADAPVLAPAAADHVVASESVVGQRSVAVDVFEGASNPGGRTSDLVVTFEGVNAELAKVDSEGRVTVTVGDARAAIAYRLTNTVDDLSAMAFIVVPRYADALPPSLKEGFEPQAVDRFPATIEWSLIDMLDVPSLREAKVIFPETMTATTGTGTLEALDDTTLSFTPAEDFDGGESVLTFQVTDGASADDPAGNRAIISFTLAIGDAEKRDQPPTFAPITIEVELGEAGTDFDLRSASAHPNPELVAELQYSNERFVSGSGAIAHGLAGSTFSSSANPNGSEAGDTAVFEFDMQLDDQEPVVGQITVLVVPTKRPMPQAIDDVEPDARSNDGYSLSVLANDFNPFAAEGEQLTVVGAVFEGDSLGATPSFTDSSVGVTTGSAKSGTITLVYTIEDWVGRRVHGKAVFVVASAPEPVTTVSLSNPSTQTVSVVFQPPTSSNGAEITGYTVRMTGSPSTTERTDCSPGAVCTFTGRTNGAVQTVEIGATNKVGTTWSTQSTITPYGTPSAPTNPVLSTNSSTATATITPSWSGPADDGGGSITYEWSFTQGISSTGSTPGTSAPGQSVGQGDYTFQVRACNPSNTCSGYVSASRHIDPAPRTVTLTKGASAASQPGCTSGNCWFLHIDVSNFAASTSFQVQCNTNGSFYFSQNITTNGAGSWSGDLNCWAGYPSTSARVDGVTSNVVNFSN